MYHTTNATTATLRPLQPLQAHPPAQQQQLVLVSLTDVVSAPQSVLNSGNVIVLPAWAQHALPPAPAPAVPASAAHHHPNQLDLASTIQALKLLLASSSPADLPASYSHSSSGVDSSHSSSSCTPVSTAHLFHLGGAAPPQLASAGLPLHTGGGVGCVLAAQQALPLSGLHAGGSAGGSARSSASGAASTGTTSLYVKGLPPDTDDRFLFQAFAPHGTLHSCKVKRDPSTGQCSGVAFVNYMDLASATRAMRALDGAPLTSGGQLNVKLQAPRAQRAANAATFRAAMQQPSRPPTAAPPAHDQFLDGGAQSHALWPAPYMSTIAMPLGHGGFAPPPAAQALTNHQGVAMPPRGEPMVFRPQW